MINTSIYWIILKMHDQESKLLPACKTQSPTLIHTSYRVLKILGCTDWKAAFLPPNFPTAFLDTVPPIPISPSQPQLKLHLFFMDTVHSDNFRIALASWLRSAQQVITVTTYSTHLLPPITGEKKETTNSFSSSTYDFSCLRITFLTTEPFILIHHIMKSTSIILFKILCKSFS